MGFIEDYQRVATAHMDSPTIFQKAVAYWVLGTALGRGFYVQFGSQRIHPNLFLALVGESGLTRKSTCKDLALEVLTTAFEDITLPGRGSPEAFRDALEDRDWYGTLYYDEFVEFLTRSRKDYASDMDTTIMELFSTSAKTPIRTKTSGEIKIPKHAIITFLAPTTIEMMRSGLKKKDYLSGKLARFMLVQGAQEFEYEVPLEMPDGTTQRLAADLRKLCPSSLPQSCQPIHLTHSPDALEVLKELHREIRNRMNQIKNPFVRGSFNRAQIYGLKLAMINAVANGRYTIEASDYYEVMPLLLNWRECLQALVSQVEDGGSVFRTLLAAAEAFLKSVKGERVLLRDFYRRVRCTKSQADEIVQFLKDTELAEITPGTNPRSAFIKWVGERDDDGIVTDAPPMIRPK